MVFHHTLTLQSFVNYKVALGVAIIAILLTLKLALEFFLNLQTCADE